MSQCQETVKVGGRTLFCNRDIGHGGEHALALRTAEYVLREVLIERNELLDSIKRVLPLIESEYSRTMSAWIEQAQAAIAKAEK